jgi:hypothetical protein
MPRQSFVKKTVLIAYIFPVIGILSPAVACFAQAVAINNDGAAPHTSAILDVKSVNKGLLIPRMTTAQRLAISSPSEGLNVFDTSTKTFWYYNGTGWVESATGSPVNFWSLNGSNIFNTNAGNIGIGTNTPTSILTLKTSLNTTGFTHIGGTNEIIVAEAIGSVSASIGTVTNHPFRIMSNNIGRLHVYTGGEVVIGSNTSGSFGQLTIETTNNNYGISHTSMEGNILATRIGGTSAGIGTFSSTNMRLFCNGISAMLIDAASGNIGIGTDGPTARLHIAGGMKIEGANTLELGAGLPGKEVNAGKIGYQSFTPDALDIIGAGTSLGNRKVKFWNEGGAEFAGNIGIGTPATFGVRLHINQDVEALRLSGNQPYMTFFNGVDFKGYMRSIGANDMEIGTAPTNTNGRLNLSIKGTPYLSISSIGKVSVNGPPAPSLSPALTVNGVFGIAGNSEWTFETDECFAPNGPCLTLYGNGFVRTNLDADGEWTAASDRSLKDDIKEYRPVLGDIKKIQVSTYHLKYNPAGKKSFGLIAQDIAEYFPEVVSPLTDKNNGKNLLGITYSKIGVLAIKAIQEQQVIIEQQQEKIETLEKKMVLIEKLLADLTKK